MDILQYIASFFFASHLTLAEAIIVTGLWVGYLTVFFCFMEDFIEQAWVFIFRQFKLPS